MMIQGRAKVGNVKIIYNATIKQALNGYIVVVEEDEPMVDSTSIPDIEEQMERVMSAIHNSSGMSSPDSDIQRIIRENNKRPNKDDLPKIKKVGVRIFATFNEAAAFLSFIFEEEDLDEKPNKTLSKNNKNNGTSLDEFTK
jgi:hypothetical protein